MLTHIAIFSLLFDAYLPAEGLHGLQNINASQFADLIHGQIDIANEKQLTSTAMVPSPNTRQTGSAQNRARHREAPAMPARLIQPSRRRLRSVITDLYRTMKNNDASMSALRNHIARVSSIDAHQINAPKADA